MALASQVAAWLVGEGSTWSTRLGMTRHFLAGSALLLVLAAGCAKPEPVEDPLAPRPSFRALTAQEKEYLEYRERIETEQRESSARELEERAGRQRAELH